MGLEAMNETFNERYIKCAIIERDSIWSSVREDQPP